MRMSVIVLSCFVTGMAAQEAHNIAFAMPFTACVCRQVLWAGAV
jgi:hypothetical protein